jgi:hypothetical protein
MTSSNESIKVSESDDLRSNYIRELIQSPKAIQLPSFKSDIPKVVIQYWHNKSEIPEDVKNCMDSWNSIRQQGFYREFFDENRGRDFILKEFGQIYGKAFDLCHHPAMRCDYFRLCYSLARGGFYVDADEVYQGTDCADYFSDNKLKIQPLCYDKATGLMVEIDTFMHNREHSPDWIFYVNNNPIVAPANHPIILLALERATRILLDSLERPEIQSTTGPGNLSASLVKHSIDSNFSRQPSDFFILYDWEKISVSPWHLSYRNDERNWRLWKP